jgi:hypothetical protein
VTDHQEIRKPCYLPAREISLVEVDSDVPFEIGIALDNATLEDVLRLIAYPTALDIGDNKTPLSARTTQMVGGRVPSLYHGTLEGDTHKISSERVDELAFSTEGESVPVRRFAPNSPVTAS